MRALLLILCILAAPLRAEPALVFAAASLKPAMDALAPLFHAETGARMVVSLAGSSALARQIEAGAPADLFVSANPGWMDALEAKGLIAPASRFDLLGNRLALVGDAPPQPVAEALAGLRGEDRLAMALVEAVPAGVYGKAALVSLGVWDALVPRVVQTDNVRAALALAVLGEARMAVVYATDAAAEPRAPLIGLFPEDSHPPIRYPAALVAGRMKPEAARLLNWLKSDVARAVFDRLGFSRP